LNKVAQVHEINLKNTQFYLILISSTLPYILPKYGGIIVMLGLI